MPGLNWIPGVSQIKSFCQLATGDVDGAKKTQKDFFHECPGFSQTVALTQFVTGDTKAAKKTFSRGIGTINNVANGIPGVGHAKSGVHLLCGDTEGASRAFQAANRSTVVMGTGVVTGALTGGVGAVAAIPLAMAAGMAHDLVDSIASDQAQGLVAAVEQAAKDPSAGNIFDATVMIAGDGLSGYSGARMGQQMAAKGQQPSSSAKTAQNAPQIGETEPLTGGGGGNVDWSKNIQLSQKISAIANEAQVWGQKIAAVQPEISTAIVTATVSGGSRGGNERVIRKVSYTYQLQEADKRKKEEEEEKRRKLESVDPESSQLSPQRHYISLVTGPDHAFPEVHRFNPSTDISVQNVPGLRIVQHNAHLEVANSAPRTVQTNSWAANRVEYMSAMVNVDHLRSPEQQNTGTDMNLSARIRARELGNEGDVAGHVLGGRFSGPGVIDNMIPQNATLNNGNWKKMENVIERDVRQYGTVVYSIRVIYETGTSTRPTHFFFKVTTTKGRLIRYGRVENPTLVETLLFGLL